MTAISLAADDNFIAIRAEFDDAVLRVINRW
jgi:hypothetical protein